jgi:hypothetical protein
VGLCARSAATAVSLVVAVTAIGACGDDADEAGPTTTQAAVAFCGDYMEADHVVGLAMAGQTDPEPVRARYGELVAGAPAELEAAIGTLDAEVQARFGGQEGPDPGDFDAAMDEVNRWLVGSCGFAEVDATATEYAYSGLPAELPAGDYVLRLRNDGAEPHELQLVRVNDGVTESVEEILGLPEGEQLERVTPLTGVFAPPDGSALQVVRLADAGTYVALCLVPQGASPGIEGGPLHVELGMFSRLTVG